LQNQLSNNNSRSLMRRVQLYSFNSGVMKKLVG
jgi:hypothetical protein